MADTFIKWLSGIISALVVFRLLVWLGVHFPLGLVPLAVGALLLTHSLFRERRLRQERGWWVEYFSPGQLRAEEDDFALVYHEGNQREYFYGKEQPRPDPNVLTVPNEASWDAQVPAWMQGRRREIMEHLEHEISRLPKTRRVQMVEVKDQ